MAEAERERSGSGAGADSVARADEEPDYNQVKSPPVYEILWFIGMLMAAPEVAVTAREGGAKSAIKNRSESVRGPANSFSGAEISRTVLAPLKMLTKKKGSRCNLNS